MSTDSQKKAQKKYDKTHKNQFRFIYLKLNKETDADIIEKLEASGNIQGFIKEAIRKISK